MRGFTAVALQDFPLVRAGDDVAKMIVDCAGKSGLEIEDGDVVVIAQKVFSKAEGRVVNLRKVTSSKRALEIFKETGKSARFVELVLKESKRLLKVARDILLVEDNRGLVCINAGIDKSNVEGRENFALLPEDPDASAERCRLEIKRLTGRNVAVIMSDTYSRPFRRGQVNFAIGLSGVSPFKDYRGTRDLFGQVLKVKNVAIVDEVAAAAELLMGQGKEKSPVVIFKGLGNLLSFCEKCRTQELFISNKDDLFKNVL